MTTSEERRIFATKIFDDYPGKIVYTIRENILLQRITEGMSPYEAYLAGGEFSYHVQADEKIWLANVDPFRVMWAQTQHPDESKINMNFENNTQYPEEEMQRFCVDFLRGRSVSVYKLKK